MGVKQFLLFFNNSASTSTPPQPGATITHDANGNLSGDGVWTYAYDTDNRLKSANKTGLAATLAYDAEGRLRQTVIAGATTHLAYDGVDLVAEYDSAGTLLRRYVHGPGVDEPLVWYEGTDTANKNWLYADHLGSVVATADAAGNSTATYTYGPYGEPNVTTGSRFRYTGQQLIGQLNLYYYKARFYSPALGRFLQTDPIGYADDMNLYAYVGNDPVNGTDPSGLAVAEARMLAGKLATEAENFLTGGYGKRFSQSLNAGNYGDATVYLGAGVLYGLGTISTGGNASLGAKATAKSVDELSQAAAAADRGGLTAAGRALQKHGGREGSAFPGAKGNPMSINQQGQHVVDDILTSPGATTTSRNHARFGKVTEVRAPDGRGVRYGPDGKFIGFLEPKP